MTSRTSSLGQVLPARAWAPSSVSVSWRKLSELLFTKSRKTSCWSSLSLALNIFHHVEMLLVVSSFAVEKPVLEVLPQDIAETLKPEVSHEAVFRGDFFRWGLPPFRVILSGRFAKDPPMKHIRILVVTNHIAKNTRSWNAFNFTIHLLLVSSSENGSDFDDPSKMGPYQFRNGFKDHHKCPLYTGFTGVTVPETNIAPANRPSQKETNIPTIHFQVLWVCHPYPWSYPTLLVEGLLWSRIGSAKLKGLTGSLVVDLRSGLCKVAI